MLVELHPAAGCRNPFLTAALLVLSDLEPHQAVLRLVIKLMHCALEDGPVSGPVWVFTVGAFTFAGVPSPVHARATSGSLHSKYFEADVHYL